MKSTIQFFLLCITAVILAACNSNQPSADQPDGEHHEGHNTTATQTVAATTGSTASATAIRLKDDHLNAIYSYYTDLTESLIAGDIAGAKVAAAAIELGAAKVNGGQAVVTSAAAIIDASDLGVQRNLYAKLSDSFIALLKNTGVANGDLYIMHCPMARGDKGAFWVSNSKTVRNPYYGQSMLTCGSVKEVLQ